MKEITELRTENTKTYKTEDGTRKVVGGIAPLHYKENGVWKDISATPTEDVENSRIEFTGLKDDVWIDTDSFCGTLNISGDGYEITVDISPFAEDISVEDELISVATADDDASIVSQSLTEHSDFQYTVTDRKIKPESTITNINSVPTGYAFKIEFSGLTAEYPDLEHKIKKIESRNGEIEEEEVVDHFPAHIDFKDDGETVYRFTEPVFVDGNGEKFPVPLKIQSKSSESIVGYYDTPANEWCKNAIEETGSLIMDPSVNSGMNYVTDGDSQSHTPPSSNIDIYNEEVRWRGVDRTETNTEEYSYNTGDSFADGIYLTGKSETTLHVESDYDGSVDNLLIRTRPRSAAGADQSPDLIDPVIQSIDHEHTGLSGYSEAECGVLFSESPENVTVETDSIDSSVAGTPVDFVFDMTEDPDYDTYDDPFIEDCRRTVTLDTIETTETTYNTQHPSASINGTSYSAPSSTLDDGEYSSFVSSNAIIDGDNTFSHSISGSNRADFQYQYDYDFLPPEAPGNVTVSGPEF